MSNVLHLPKCKNKVICWRKMDESDRETAVHFIKDFYLKNEPTFQAMKLTEEDYSSVVDNAIDLLKKKQSICAYDQETKRVVGVVFSPGPLKFRDLKPHACYEQPSFKRKQVLHLVVELHKGLPKDVNDDDLCMHGQRITTHPDYASLGIAMALMKKMKELAKEQGCKYFLAKCTSHFAARIHEKLGAVILHQISYADYVDPLTKEKVFAGVKPPHKYCKLHWHNL